ncbi:preprotein translocase subunit YajC [Alteriqipengyuania sp. WL0013]|nr:MULTISPECIES: preprotein translocase subunit YajC [Alteriqipengyuania]MEB3415348.1 preprotein translocase subunit YajC [Alteriqipengyuania sp. WL0013]WJY18632.1 preprotein translocase subunit YajC [Alteriqipengyuania flavescens]WJY24572.1 preprotein translocase subunit YajC [Alteriqipengyuania flavescens]
MTTFILAAATSGAEAPPAWMQFAPLVAMGLIFYFLLIRPGMKRQREHREKVEGLKKGDQVVTAGGLVGKITKVDDHYVTIDLGGGTKVQAVRHTIGDVIDPGTKPAAND